MRPQYHFRKSPNGYFAWDVRKLIVLAESLPVIDIPLAEIGELDETYWFQDFDSAPTVRAVAEHARLIAEAELRWPVLLCAQGRVMDGMHRIARASLDGRATIAARRFRKTPAPDYADVWPDQLPYD